MYIHKPIQKIWDFHLKEIGEGENREELRHLVVISFPVLAL